MSSSFFSVFSINKPILNRITFTAFAILLLDLVSFFIFDQQSLLRDLFNVVTEKNIPTLFSTLNLGISGFLLHHCYKLSKEAELGNVLAPYWRLLAFTFYFLAFDEWISIHDVIGKPISKAISPAIGDAMKWTFLYSILSVLFFLYFLRFLIKLPKRTAILFVISGFLFCLGAMGFELAGFYSEHKYLFGFIEEALEILSIVLFNLVIFDYIRQQFKTNDLKGSGKKLFWIVLLCFIDIVATYSTTFKGELL